MRLNPFRDITRDARAEFIRKMDTPPESFGNEVSDRLVPYLGSELTYTQYNEIFEGDSRCFALPTGYSTAAVRDMKFQGDGSNSSTIRIEAERGLLGTELYSSRSHFHVVTGGGDDLIQYDGNSQRNICLVEAGAGEKLIVQNLGAGDDKSVLFLDQTEGTILVQGGAGHDRLEIRPRSPETKWSLMRDVENFPEPGDGFQGLRIATQGVEEVEVYPLPDKA